MKTIIVASTNPVKVRAVAQGFQKMFPDEEFVLDTVSVPSGVSNQPRSDAETLKGAENRARQAALQIPDADFWAGLEGGIDEQEDAMSTFAWIVVLGRERRGKARTSTLFLPDAVAALVREGKELGEADDIVFGRANSKQDNGAVGLLTGNVVDRTQAYEQAIILALIPFRNPLLYHK